MSTKKAVEAQESKQWGFNWALQVSRTCKAGQQRACVPQALRGCASLRMGSESGVWLRQGFLAQLSIWPCAMPPRTPPMPPGLWRLTMLECTVACSMYLAMPVTNAFLSSKFVSKLACKELKDRNNYWLENRSKVAGHPGNKSPPTDATSSWKPLSTSTSYLLPGIPLWVTMGRSRLQTGTHLLSSKCLRYTSLNSC